MEDHSRWQREDRILDLLLDLEPEERPAALKRTCAGDGALAEAVERLLRAAEQESPLDQGLAGGSDTFVQGLVERHRRRTAALGDEIGPYRLERLLGEGGMGTVFLARRWDGEPERPVAFKILHRGPADEQAHRRFLREKEILAGLRHPHVARLLDGGVTADGVPYLVLEHVDGEPITAYCQNRDLDREARLRLFLQAAAAVRYAHGQGIVHRDLKPSNVLVEEGPEGEATAYVLDFGVASRQDQLEVTRTGQVVGTLGYMAPEQASSAAGPVDQRSDVFSLGVLLFELLSGRRPFEGDSSGDVLLQLLDDEPPSLRSLCPDLPVDLERIVMVCLAREPRHRYGSVAALEEDLERFLDGRPVTARPLGPVARLWRRARRRPAVAMALAVAAFVLLGGALKYARDVSRERVEALTARGEAEDLMEFMLRDLHGGLLHVGRLDLLEEVALQAVDYYGSRPWRQLEGEDLFRRGLTLYNAGYVLEEKGRTEEALEAYARHREISAHLGASEPGVRWDFEMTRVEQSMAGALAAEGRNEEALERVEGALSRSRQVAALAPEGMPWAHIHFECLAVYGWLLREAGRMEEAHGVLEEALALARSQGALGGEERSWLHRQAVAHSFQGLVHQEQGNLEKAIRSFRLGRDLCEELVARDPTNVRWLEELQLVHSRLAYALELADQALEALVSAERAITLAQALVELDPANPGWRRELAVAYGTATALHRQLGQLEQAQESLEASLAISRAGAEENPEDASAQNDLAWDLLEQGRLRREAGRGDEAAAYFTEAADVLREEAREGSDLYLLDTYVQTLLEQGRGEEALPFFRRLQEAGWQDPDLDSLARLHGLLPPRPETPTPSTGSH